MMNRNYIYVLIVLIVAALFIVMPAAAEEHAHNNADGWLELNTQTVNSNDYQLKTGKYYLTEDISLIKTLTIAGNVELDLNGQSLTLTKDTDHVITINNKGVLTLMDCKNSGKIIGLKNSNGNKIGDYGGGINIESGKLTMNGGTIFECTAHHGGGIYVSSSSEFIMNGGTIESCYGVSGAGIYNEGKTILNGGVIDGKGHAYSKEYQTNFGGGIYNAGEMTINDCTIINCQSKRGAGIYNDDSLKSIAVLTINGGIIKDCLSEYHINGDCLYALKPVTMNSGTLDGNIIVNKASLKLDGPGLILGDIRLIESKLIIADSWDGYNRAGYTFDGWFRKYNNDYTKFNDQKSGMWQYTAKGDETIQARWTKSASSTPVQTQKPTETISVQPTVINTPEPTETQTSEPVQTATQASASPLPLAGIIAGCAAALFVCRRH
ncbi:MAG TPA: right-handed parallel beta-helix repeat-containing protein [Methanocorpusculum sp.]|nr:right-handed parallel beta-helix repeat-containing protein [Methanocorpusculum sp.]